MPPAAATREEERRLNSRTLTIASVASASAAAVTSQLWIAGTWIAAALTPVLVAVISEALHRPTERVARAWTAERGPGGESRPRAQTGTRGEPAAVTGSAGPVRMYRQTSRGVAQSGRGVARPGRGIAESGRGPAVLSGRRIPWRAVLLTGAAAFAIAIATITAIDLASTGSVNTTPLGHSSSASTQTNDSKQREERQERPAPQEEQSTTPDDAPSTTQPDDQQTPPSSDTAPVTPPTETAPGAVPNSTP
jgi:hypothetical protein